MSALTLQLTRGDDQAYRIFHDAYFDRLWRYLLVVTRGREEAARDALQETFRRVVKHIRVFPSEPVFWSWLTVLARTSLVDESRKRRRYLAFLDRFTQHAALGPRPDPAANSDDQLQLLLDQNLSLLPADERQLLEWKYSDSLSVREIAGRLETTEKSVESRLGRIRQKLRTTILTDLHHEPPV